MRHRFAAATVITALLASAAAAAADPPSTNVPESHVLVFSDFAMEWGPKFQNISYDTFKTLKHEIEQALTPVLDHLARESGANVVIEKSLVLSGGDDADMSMTAMAALPAPYTLEFRSAPPNTSALARAASHARLVFVDREAVALTGSGTALNPAGPVNDVLREMKEAYGATLIVDSSVCVYSEWGCDRSAEAVRRIMGDTVAPPVDPLPVPRAIAFRRSALLIDSTAGKALEARTAALLAHPARSGSASYVSILTAKRRALRQLQEALQPILRDLATAHGANLVLNRDALKAMPDGVDVTDEAIRRLNAAVRSVPFDLPSSK